MVKAIGERGGYAEDRAAALCAAPGGCAFLLVLREAWVSAELASDPALALAAAAIGMNTVTVWRSDHARIVQAVLAEGPGLVAMAREILAQPQTGWWFGPLDRAAQLWISRRGEPPVPEQLAVPHAPPDAWERYAQKPAGGLFTSTLVAGSSAVLAALAHGTGDYHVALPLVLYRLVASPSARVFEVTGPEAWYRLCTSYPARGEDGRLVPDWSRVAQDWDGVHLTFGGLLAVEQVRVDTTAGWTELWGWDFEQTVWLRWSFTAVTRLPDLHAYPVSPVDLRRPLRLVDLSP